MCIVLDNGKRKSKNQWRICWIRRSGKFDWLKEVDFVQSFSRWYAQLKHALEELNRVVETKEEIEHRCRELDLQITALQDDKLGLIQETARLNERIHQYENIEDAE